MSEPIARVAVEQFRSLDVWLFFGLEETGARRLGKEVTEMFARGAHELLIEKAEVGDDEELEFVGESGECAGRRG